MSHKKLSVALAALLVTGSGQAYSQGASGSAPGTSGPLKPETIAHLAAAREAAAYDFPAPLAYCENIQKDQKQFSWLGNGATRKLGGPWNAEPGEAKIFDNMYYLGVRSVTSWAVTTPQGIILFDALNNADEAKEHIEGGLRKFGLDPANIKYIVITHGHADHFGGSKYLQEKYHARVLMGGPDWDLVAKPRPAPAPAAAGAAPGRGAGPRTEPPTKDITITDGYKLPGGIRLYLAPGHTLGTIDALIPVTDHGKKHLVALHGGSGLTNGGGAVEAMGVAGYKLYADSNDRFIKIAMAAGADVPLSDHDENDLAIIKTDKLAKRQPGEPNPFVMGKDAVRRLFFAFAECSRAWYSQLSN